MSTGSMSAAARRTLAGLLLLLLWTWWAPPARADELHLKNGKVVHGRLQEQTRSGFKFLATGDKRAKTHRKRDVERIVLTYSEPEPRDDPAWTEEEADARVAASFDAEWGDVEILRSEHYIVFTNSSAGERYLKTMEDIYDKFIKIFPFEEPVDARLMPVFLFKTNDHYYQFYANIAGVTLESARRSGGHAWRDYYATYYLAPKDPVHYHEGAHQLVGNRLRLHGGGSWFQEGMAVYFEGTVFPGEDPAKGMKGEVKSGRHTPLEELFQLRSLLYSSDTVKESDLGRRRYRQAGAVIKFLKEGPYAEHFDAMLAGVGERQSWESIFGQIFHMSIADVEQAFVKYYRG